MVNKVASQGFSKFSRTHKIKGVNIFAEKKMSFCTVPFFFFFFFGGGGGCKNMAKYAY